MLTQLFYTSLSRSARGHSSDFAILSQALENNRRLGLTGYLLRDPLRFYQVLEGPTEVVEATFGRIAADPRHVDIRIMMRRTVAERSFLGWSMGYADLAGEDAAWFDWCCRGTRPKGVSLDRLARRNALRVV